ncbi:MAG: hypothetical protein IPM96_02710 [Ignavibacteria bacterium]|nr:hypothetical protein [Ignavibacteria bacterium]
MPGLNGLVYEALSPRYKFIVNLHAVIAGDSAVTIMRGLNGIVYAALSHRIYSFPLSHPQEMNI